MKKGGFGLISHQATMSVDILDRLDITQMRVMRNKGEKIRNESE